MIRTAIALVFLGLQVVMIVRARFDPHRYYCWAPHDQQTTYRYEVRIGGRLLTEREAVARYRDPWGISNPRAAEHANRFLHLEKGRLWSELAEASEIEGPGADRRPGAER